VRVQALPEGGHESMRGYSIASKPVRMQVIPEKRRESTRRYSIVRQKGRAWAQIAHHGMCREGQRSRWLLKQSVVEHHLRQILKGKVSVSLDSTS
jgi:hypothetical protein